MRAAIDHLVNPHPIAGALPGIYDEDELVGRFTAGLDDVFAPIVSTLDCLSAYLDPMLAPLDFVEWLAGWVGLIVDDDAAGQQRSIVANAAEHLRARGTIRGLRLELMVAGVEARVEDSGGAWWTNKPGQSLPADVRPWVRVTVARGEDGHLDERRIEKIVARAKPAHVVHEIEVTGPSSPPLTGAPAPVLPTPEPRPQPSAPAAESSEPLTPQLIAERVAREIHGLFEPKEPAPRAAGAPPESKNES